MTERTKREKPREQDWLGFLFCILGGFATVSIALSWAGWESKGTFLTLPVEELLVLVGGTAALVLSAGAAVLGSLFFLRPEPMPTWRLSGALVAGALGLALVAGAFGWGGELGAVFPGLLSGFSGRMLGALLGVVVLWVALVLAAPRRSRSGVDAVQRVGLSPRADFAGVSAAESALLVSDPNQRAPRPSVAGAPGATLAPARREVTPLRQESIRPQPPPRAAEPLAARRSEPAAALVQPVVEDAAAAPPAPAWEAEAPPEEPEEPEELEETLEELDELEEALEDEELGEAEEEQADEAPLAGEVPVTPSWEQVGLFDEEPVEEPPVPQEAPALVARATEAAGAVAETSEDPFAGPSPLELAADDEEDEDDEEELDEEEEDGDDLDEDEEASAEPKPEPEFVLAPRHAAAASAPDRKAEARAAAPRSPEPRVEGDGDERWRQLVFDAGCLVLEQNRVAVSMLERRFGIDFDQACGLLDELQQAGLIGPYMGGRTRDILLSRDEWLAHAPHAS